MGPEMATSIKYRSTTYIYGVTKGLNVALKLVQNNPADAVKAIQAAIRKYESSGFGEFEQEGTYGELLKMQRLAGNFSRRKTGSEDGTT